MLKFFCLPLLPEVSDCPKKIQAQRKPSVIAIALAYTGRVPVPTVVDSSKNGEQYKLSLMIFHFSLKIESPIVLMHLEPVSGAVTLTTVE